MTFLPCYFGITGHIVPLILFGSDNRSFFLHVSAASSSTSTRRATAATSAAAAPSVVATAMAETTASATRHLLRIYQKNSKLLHWYGKDWYISGGFFLRFRDNYNNSKKDGSKRG
jgi:hypothetical protein